MSILRHRSEATTARRPHRPRLTRRGAITGAALAVVTLGSYGVARAFAGSKGAVHPYPASWGAVPKTPSRPGQPVRRTNPFVSGQYLVAYVLMSSECGWCKDPTTEDAVRAIRDSLAHAYNGRFARVSVIGISIDSDVNAGVSYLEQLGGAKSFDQISVGGVWLNELVQSLVWKDGAGKAAAPQVILVRRKIDASRYPDFIEIDRDSVLQDIIGRDSLVAWVRGGVPLGGSIRRSTKS
jgi:hypothetical protein